jgi:hypothetical protein
MEKHMYVDSDSVDFILTAKKSRVDMKILLRITYNFYILIEASKYIMDQTFLLSLWLHTYFNQLPEVLTFKSYWKPTSKIRGKFLTLKIYFLWFRQNNPCFHFRKYKKWVSILPWLFKVKQFTVLESGMRPGSCR